MPDTAGLSPGSAAHTTILPFNDLEALERALSAGDVALVLTEPVMTNCNLIMPDPDFHRGVRELTRRYGTLLCIDEAHTFQFAFGGLSRAWRLDAGLHRARQGFGQRRGLRPLWDERRGGGLLCQAPRCGHRPAGHCHRRDTYASALATAVARVVLEEVMTADAYERVRSLGAMLADGLDARLPATRAAVEGVQMRSPLRVLPRARTAADRRGRACAHSTTS